MKTKKLTYIVITALILALAVGGFLFYKHRTNNADKNTTTTAFGETVNLNPPTDSDKKDVDANKEKIVTDDEANKNSGKSTTTIKPRPSITYADDYGATIEVGAVVQGVFEDGGTCTATLSNGASKKTKSVNAVKNVSTTDCPAMIFQQSELSTTGQWTASVTYTSSSGTGTSDAKTITVR